MVSTIHAKTSRFQRIFTWRMSNAATPASRVVFTRPTSTADARNMVAGLGDAGEGQQCGGIRAHRSQATAGLDGPEGATPRRWFETVRDP